ncbi:hypothetical protein [Capillimicrobium parvum]|uniref:hypothetical protein n=1 Tax=Capillimicrobium parvum TaxID=2884022 RepID=UPI00216ABE36|nr:hypothetical protein [Capillimicrobium parvum]
MYDDLAANTRLDDARHGGERRWAADVAPAGTLTRSPPRCSPLTGRSLGPRSLVWSAIEKQRLEPIEPAGPRRGGSPDGSRALAHAEDLALLRAAWRPGGGPGQQDEAIERYRRRSNPPGSAP